MNYLLVNSLIEFLDFADWHLNFNGTLLLFHILLYLFIFPMSTVDIMQLIESNALL